MRLFKPSEVRGQSQLLGGDFRDHSDHLAASYFADEAYKKYLAEGNQTSKKNYLGYPVREKVANIYGADLAAKEAAFFTYAKFDPSVCKSRELCKNIQTYSGYLQRQYHFPE